MKNQESVRMSYDYPAWDDVSGRLCDLRIDHDGPAPTDPNERRCVHVVISQDFHVRARYGLTRRDCAELGRFLLSLAGEE